MNTIDHQSSPILYDIDPCWEDFARPGEVEVWSAFDAMTPEALADRLYRLCTGRGSQLGEVYDLSGDREGDELMIRCLKAATSALDNIFKGGEADSFGVPVEMSSAATLSIIHDSVFQFVLKKLDRYYLAVGGIGRAEISAARRRAGSAARRAVGSLFGERD